MDWGLWRCDGPYQLLGGRLLSLTGCTQQNGLLFGYGFLGGAYQGVLRWDVSNVGTGEGNAGIYLVRTFDCSYAYMSQNECYAAEYSGHKDGNPKCVS